MGTEFEPKFECLEVDFRPATQFGYTVPQFGSSFPNCSMCVNSLGSDGRRHWGAVLAGSVDSSYFGKLVCYCSKQDGHVLPYARCDLLKTEDEDV